MTCKVRIHPATAVLQPVKEVRGKVADYDGSTSSQDSLCRLKGHCLQVKDAGLGSGVDHGVLAADLVCGYGQILAQVLGVTDNVEVLAGRLHHDDIGSLVDISNNSTSSKTAATRGKLLVVETAIIAEDTAVAVRGVLAKTDIAANEKLRESAADDLNGSDNGTFGVVGGSAKSILGASLHGNTKEHDGTETLVDERLEERNQLVAAELVLTRERRDEDHVALTVGDKEGVDKHRL
ncbi:hypothetical protein HG531_007954 [Fusarium graminearum]|nr:hypothetical protein HG531_007954 [Fusarium graminearum]